jgi:hypothetical protein
MGLDSHLVKSPAPRARHAGRRPRERGVAVLITLLVVLGVGIGLVTSGVTRTIPLKLRAENKAALAMAEAKQALIGRAAADGDRPGSLPCPDATNQPASIPPKAPNDGFADNVPGPADLLGDCPSYIGRLPWRTLGLPDLRDEHGERLWYALSPKYRDHVRAQPINSDTPADVPPDPTRNDRLVYANTTASTLAPKAMAIIFSPGGPVGAQLRDATPAPCAATGTTIPRNECVSNYLEAAGGVDNASLTGPYIAAQKTSTFNDRLVVITPADLMPLVEVRVASELRTVLIDYRIESKCKCFPWAADAFGKSVPGWNRGRFPSQAAPDDWGDSGKVPVLPAWFDVNRWGDVIYYTASEQAVEQPPKGPKCVKCTSPTLVVNDEIGYSALFIMPGPAVAPRTPGTWTDYIEDTANTNQDDSYITPTSTAMARDRLILMPSGSPLQCAANSTMLFQNAPCELKKGTKKKTIKPECAYAVQNLQICTCKAAADQLVIKPCSKKIKKSACKGAVTTLKVCNA